MMYCKIETFMLRIDCDCGRARFHRHQYPTRIPESCQSALGEKSASRVAAELRKTRAHYERPSACLVRADNDPAREAPASRTRHDARAKPLTSDFDIF